MKELKFMIIAITLILASTSFAAEVLTLEESIEIALENNRNLRLAQQELRHAQGQITEAWGGALPTVSVDAGVLYKEEKPTMTLLNYNNPMDPPIVLEVGERDNYFANVTVTQPIWVGGKVGAALAGAKLYSKYAQHNFQNAEQMVIYGTKLAFYGVLLAEESVKVAEESFELSQKHLERVQKFYEQGLVSRFDLLRAEVNVANTEPKVISAINSLDLAINKFKSTIGLDLEEEVELKGDLAFDPYEIDYDAALDLALENRQDWKALDYQIAGQEKLVRIRKGDYYPIIALMGKYEGSQSGLKEDSAWSKELSATLALSWSWEYGIRGRVRQEKARYAQLNIQKRQMKDDIELAVKEAILSLEEAKEILMSQSKTVGQAEESYHIAEVRYENGTGTELEVSDARLALNLAKMNYIKALFDYSVAKTTLQKVTGTLK